MRQRQGFKSPRGFTGIAVWNAMHLRYTGQTAGSEKGVVPEGVKA